MAFPLARVKNWASLETLVYSDLNAEFDNILNNNKPANIDDYSSSVNQMQTETSPGAVGTESQATTLAGEVERLRYVVHRLIDNNSSTTKWYTAPSASMDEIRQNVPLVTHRIVSGLTRGTLAANIVSNQPAFLVANAASGVKLSAASTNFKYRISTSSYTVSSDLTAGPLSAATASNNTCAINLTGLTATYETKLLGEENGVRDIYGGISTVHTELDSARIPVDAMGSAISGIVGQLAAFSVVHGGNTEYFIARVESTTAISLCKRGYFFDSSGNPIPRIAVADNDVITLMKLTWCFVRESSGSFTLDITYNQPTYSVVQPSSPAIGDYWFDFGNSVWKKYDGSSFNTVNSIFTGYCFQDSTGSTIGSRSADFFKTHSSENSVNVKILSGSTTVEAVSENQSVVVYGSKIFFQGGKFSWDYTNDRESGYSPAAADKTYFYMTDLGRTLFSSTPPYNRYSDLGGYYHPYNPWRCVAIGFLNGTPNGFSSLLFLFGSDIAKNANEGFSTTAIDTSTTSSSYADLTNGVVSLRTPVGTYECTLINSSTGGYIEITGSGTGAREVSLCVSAVDDCVYRVFVDAAGESQRFPLSSFRAVVFIGTGGVTTFSLQGKVNTANTTLAVHNAELSVRRIK